MSLTDYTQHTGDLFHKDSNCVSLLTLFTPKIVKECVCAKLGLTDGKQTSLSDVMYKCNCFPKITK